MRKQLAPWWSAPPAAPTPNSHTAYWLLRLLAVAAAMLLFYIVALPSSNYAPEVKRSLMLMDVAALAAGGLLLWLLQNGRERLAAVLFISFLFAGAVVPAIFVLRTASAPNLLGLFMIIPATGLLLGRRAMMLVLWLAAFTLMLAYSLDLWNTVPAQPQNGSILEQYATLLLVVVFNTLLLRITLHGSEQHAQELEAGAKALAQSNSQLLASQAQIQRARAELEQRVEERTAELDRVNHSLRQEIAERQAREEELRTAKEKAEAAAGTKSQFLANMSHEIRTPMNGVLGVADLLGRTPLNSEQRDLLEMIRTSSQSLLAILSDILDFSKLEAEGLTFEQEPFALHRCVTGALDVVAAAAAEKGLGLYCCLDPHVPQTIVSDELRLRQVLVNLLSNAVKFTQRGQVVVTAAVAPEGGELIFCVEDTGMGIAPDKLDRLFQSFSQVDESHTRRFGGTGLGLAISKALCERQGGWITVSSVPNVGSRFFFTWPLRLPPAPAQEEKGAGVYASLRGKLAAVLDANATGRRILCGYLETEGVRVAPVASCNELRSALRTLPPLDALICCLPPSLAMSTGLLEETQRLGLQCPLLYYATINNIQLGSLAGRPHTGILFQPFRPHDLLFKLRELLAGGMQAGGSEEMENPGEYFSVLYPAKVLLVEDNVVNQKVVLRLLGRLGYAAHLAANGAEALALAEKHSYSLIFMDIQMPFMDGLEATQRIRALPERPVRPTIIALTAAVTAADRQQCLLAGMDDYLTKPLSLQRLAQAIRDSSPPGGGDFPAAYNREGQVK